MDTRGNARLREMLAAEYALGTLRGGARRRFERWTRRDPELLALALAWSGRLAPLIDVMPSRFPPPRVWEAIEARLPGRLQSGQPAAPFGWWNRVGPWRGLSAALATTAVVALAWGLRPQLVVEPRVVQVEPQVRPAEPRVVEVDRIPDAVATLVDAKSGKPVAVVFATGGGRALMVKVASDVVVDEGKGLQLWMAPSDAKGLVSLGMLPPSRGEPVPVAGADAATVARAKAFGLSLEPAGGSPKATRVLGFGDLVRLSP